MTDSSDIASNIVQALYISDPEIDTSIGSPLRKIIDAVSVQIAQATTDQFLTNYQYDIDSATGGNLDDFCANFGIARLPGTRSTGVVTFARPDPTDTSEAILIPMGTQVGTTDIPSQTFLTIVSTVLEIGSPSVDIPCQAVTQGPDGNIQANTPLTLISTVAGIDDVSNAAAFSGGTLDETDDQLRARFKATVFRSLAGTDSMYTGTALQTLANNASGSFGVAQASVLGASIHNYEQIQVVSGTATSSLNTAAYVYTDSLFISDGDGGLYVTPTNFTATITQGTTYGSSASVTINAVSVGGTSRLPDGIYYLEYDYVPNASRNDPAGVRWSGGVVNNRVDIYVNGINPTSATQTAVYNTGVTFSSSSSSQMYTALFTSLLGGTPAAGDIFIPLAYGPIIDLNLPVDGSGNELLTIGGNTYTRGPDFDIIHRDDAFGYAAGSLYGLWWKQTTRGSSPSNPFNNTAFTLAYTYNQTPYQVANDVANWRLLGTDVKVHAGKPMYIRFNIAVVYLPNFVQASVNTNITAALTNYLQTLGFHAGLQVSDVIQVIHNVPGVDNVRFLTSADDSTNYGMQSVRPDGTVTHTWHDSSGNPRDVYFDERTYPVIDPIIGVRIVPKARNTFRT